MDFFDPKIRLPKHPVAVAATLAVVLFAILVFLIMPVVPIAIDWSMEERTGLDRNGNGIVDLPFDTTYSGAQTMTRGQWPEQDPYYPVPPDDLYEVQFRASPQGSYHWTVQECPSDPCVEDSPVVAESSEQELKAFLHQRRYIARVSFRPNGALAAFVHRNGTTIVEPKDILWVAIGDSFSAGEGNPEVVRTQIWDPYLCTSGSAPGLDVAQYSGFHDSDALARACTGDLQDVGWGDPSLPSGFWFDAFYHSEFTRFFLSSVGSHRLPLNPVWSPWLADPLFERYLYQPTARSANFALRSHRSSYSWPALAATALEREDPHSSVTFLHLAASGAGITEGLLNDYQGVDLEPATAMNTYRMAGQIEQAQGLLECWDPSVSGYRREHCRKIDVLSISIGINDIGFQQILYSLTKSKTGLSSAGMSSDEIATAVLTGHWHRYDSDLDDVAAPCANNR